MFRVYKQVGDPVKAGEVIALVDAAEVGRAKSEFLQAVAEVRLKTKELRGPVGGGEQRARFRSAGFGKAKPL